MEKTEITRIAFISIHLIVNLHYYTLSQRGGYRANMLHHEFFEAVLLTSSGSPSSSNYCNKKRSG